MENNENYESENVDIPLGDIPAVDPKSSIDVSKYEGKKFAIDEIKIKKEINFYPDGQTFTPTSTEKMFRFYIYTVPLPELDTNGNPTGKVLEIEKDGKREPIRVHARFNLNTGNSGLPELSKHPKSKVWAFCRKMGVNSLAELKGKLVMLTSEPSKMEGDDRKFLRIVT